MKKSILLIISLTLWFHSAVFSQESDRPERKGVVFGVSSGAGYSLPNAANTNLNDFGLALDAKLGYLITPKTALLLTTNVSVYDYTGQGRDRKRDFGILAPALQYWTTDRLWVLAGVGLGGDNPVFWDIKNPDADPLETRYYFGPGVVGSVGYEIYRRKNFAIDLKTKVTYRNVKYPENKTSGVSFALLLGFNLY